MTEEELKARAIAASIFGVFDSLGIELRVAYNILQSMSFSILVEARRDDDVGSMKALETTRQIIAAMQATTTADEMREALTMFQPMDGEPS